MAVQVVSIGSGSSGNALLIHDEQTSLLVDCGIGPRTIEAALRARGLTWASISGVVISHEHSDHIKALPAALRKNARIFSTEGTARAAGIAAHQFQPIEAAEAAFGPALSVKPLALSHDATEPCGFDISMGATRVCVITDTGKALDHFLEPIRNADLLVLEANHDEQMLWRGPYPHYLKVRVASAKGHLSNDAAGELLGVALSTSESIPEIWLGHLSETNNRPQTAINTVGRRLETLSHVPRLTALSRYGGETWSSDRAPLRQLRMIDLG